MMGSDWSWLFRRWHVYGERLWDITSSRHRMSGGSSTTEVEPQGVRGIIPPVNPVKDRDDARHCCGGDEAGCDCGTTLLSCDSFLHQSDIPLLLFGGTTLGPQGSLEDMV